MKDSNNVVNKVDTGLSTVPTLSCSHDFRCHIVHSHDLVKYEVERPIDTSYKNTLGYSNIRSYNWYPRCLNYNFVLYK